MYADAHESCRSKPRLRLTVRQRDLPVPVLCPPSFAMDGDSRPLDRVGRSAHQQLEQAIHTAETLSLGDAEVGEIGLAIAAVVRDIDENTRRYQDLERELAETTLLRDSMVLQLRSQGSPSKRRSDEEGESSSPTKTRRSEQHRPGSVSDVKDLKL